MLPQIAIAFIKTRILPLTDFSAFPLEYSSIVINKYVSQRPQIYPLHPSDGVSTFHQRLFLLETQRQDFKAQWYSYKSIPIQQRNELYNTSEQLLFS